MNCSIDLRGWYWIIDFFFLWWTGLCRGNSVNLCISENPAYSPAFSNNLPGVNLYKHTQYQPMLLLNVVGEDILRYLVVTMLIQVRPSASLILLWDSLCLLLEPVYLTLWPVWWWQEKVNISVMFDQQHFIIVLDIVWGQLLKKKQQKKTPRFCSQAILWITKN